MRAIPTKQSAKRKRRRPNGLCFVLMPFRPDLDELYVGTIRPCIERASRLSALRADEIYGSRAIIADIWDSIQRADLILADVTGRNPNVFYELGLAHAIQKPVLIISQNINDVPFDLKHLRVIIYQNTLQGRLRLKTNLKKAIGSDHRANLQTFFTSTSTVEGAERPDRKRITKLVFRISSADPATSISAMGELTKAVKSSQRPRNCDPRAVSAVCAQLGSAYPEVQLAAIDSLKKTGDQVHAASLLHLLSSANLVVVSAVVDALGELRALGAEPALIKMASNDQYCPCREAIFGALGKIGGPQGAGFFVDILRSNDDADSQSWAVEGLSQIEVAKEHLLTVPMERMASGARLAIATAIIDFEMYSVRVRDLVSARLRQLMEDETAEVRGTALAAYCLFTLPGEETYLPSRELFWSHLLAEEPEAAQKCLSDLSGYTDPFLPDETAELLRLASRQAELTDDIALHIGNVGDVTAAQFMIDTYLSGVAQLWVLHYFARVPFKGAAGILQEVINTESDPSTVCLAAVGLMKTNEVDTTALLVENVSKSHDWVKEIVKDHLKDLLQQRRRTVVSRANLLKIITP